MHSSYANFVLGRSTGRIRLETRARGCVSTAANGDVSVCICWRWISGENRTYAQLSTLLSVREVWGSIPGPSNWTQCHHRLVTAVTFLRSCVAQALSCGDGPLHSLLALA